MNIYFCKQINLIYDINLIRKILTYILVFIWSTSEAQDISQLPKVDPNEKISSIMIYDTLKQLSTVRTDSLTLVGMNSLSVSKNDSTRGKKPVEITDPINYTAADSIIISMDNKEVFLYKKASVTYQDIELKADFIKLNLNTKDVYAEGVPDSSGVMDGEPVFKQGSDEYKSKNLRYNFKSEKGIIHDIDTQQGEGYLKGETTKRIGQKEYIMKNGKYTTCNKEHPDFYLMMTKAKVIPNKKTITGPAYLVLADFPIYFPFLPFGYFPDNPSYSSGVIIPTYGEEETRGFFLKQGGYYWAASPYYDVTVLGDIYSKGSWAMNISSKYKNRYKYSGQFSFAYNINQYGEKDIPDSYKTKGFNLRWSHSQDSKANPYQTFSASVNLSTSSYDKENSDNYENYLSSTKSSSISFSKKWENSPFSMTANLSHSQNTSSKTMSLSLPTLTFNMTKLYPFRSENRSGKIKWYEQIGISYSGNIKNSITAPEDSIFNQSLIKDWKNGWQHNTSLSLPNFSLFKYINLSPSINYTERWYTNKLDMTYYYDQSSGTETLEIDTIYGFQRNYQYSFSIGSSTNIYGMYMIKNPNSKLKAIRHKVTPSVSFSYQPDFGAEKYGFWGRYSDYEGNEVLYNRFQNAVLGSAGRGKSEAMSFSINNSLEAKVLKNDKKEDKNKNLAEVSQSQDNTDIEDSKSKDKFEKVSIIDNLGISGSYNFVADSMKLSTFSLNARTTIKDISFNFSGILDPYMANSDGRKYNEYTWNHRSGIGKLGRLTSASFSFGLNFNSKKKNNSQKPGTDNVSSSTLDKTEEAQVQSVFNPLVGEREYLDFDMPWNLNLSYSCRYSHSNPYEKNSIDQSVNVSGNLDLTKKWKMRMTTNLDIEARKFSYTTVNLTKDLHCFTMSFNVVPFGERKSYSFTISASSAILQDLKIDKRKSWRDN